MPDRNRYNGLLLPLLVLASITGLLILSGGCGCNKTFYLPNQSFQENETSSPVSAIEVYHFHPDNQCVSCQVLGELAEETVNTFFSAERSEGKLIFAHINAELPENADLVSRFGVTLSSIMIGYTDETGFHADNQISLWYKIDDKEAFMIELRRALDEKLKRGYTGQVS